MRDAGIPAHGIDLDTASVELCRTRGLSAEVADLFPFLAKGSGTPFDGIFAAQIVGTPASRAVAANDQAVRRAI